MVTLSEPIRNLDALRDYVQRAICSREQFEPGAFPISQRLLVRRGAPCGVWFCVHGPREVKFTAIWESAGNTVLFYGCQGERLARQRLRGQVRLPG
jgi:hypothetical protein